MVRDPEYLCEQRKELEKQPLNFNFIGLSLLVVTIVCWEVVLSKGQERDWLSDAFGRVQVCSPSFLLQAPAWCFGKCVTPAPSSISGRCVIGTLLFPR
jgi:DHA2 family multidrug resistance protein